MKTWIFYTLTFLLFVPANFAYSGDLEPMYSVSKPKTDRSLKKTESVFVCTFTYKGEPVTHAVTVYCNGRNRTLVPDGKGKFVLKLEPGEHVLKFNLTEDFFTVETEPIRIKAGQKIEMKVQFKSSIAMITR